MATVVTYLGWSGFRVESEGESVLVDAYRTGLSEPAERRDRDGWGRGASAVVVTHGHHDHCGDAPELLRRNPGAPLVADDTMARFAERRWHVPAGRCAGPHWKGKEVSVDLLPATHFPEGSGDSVKKGLRYTLAHPRKMARLMRQRRESPGDAPMHVARIEAGGRTVLHACETLHRDADDAQVMAWKGEEEIDCLLAGVEAGMEPSIVRWTELLKPRRVLLFSPHRPTRRSFGDDEGSHGVDLATLAERLRRLPHAPAAEVAVEDHPVPLRAGAEA